MSVDGLLLAMFPGDRARDIPGIAALRLAANTIAEPGILQTIGFALSDLPEIEAADVNDTLRALRKSHPDAAQAFIDAALTAYFTAPEVVRALRDGSETLFPHARTLPDIDYELLEPLFELTQEKVRE
jgi:hypothetical protein